jgi:hypothetical protein
LPWLLNSFAVPPERCECLHNTFLEKTRVLCKRAAKSCQITRNWVGEMTPNRQVRRFRSSRAGLNWKKRPSLSRFQSFVMSRVPGRFPDNFLGAIALRLTLPIPEGSNFPNFINFGQIKNTLYRPIAGSQPRPAAFPEKSNNRCKKRFYPPNPGADKPN